jgi:hypothetical protein
MFGEVKTPVLPTMGITDGRGTKGYSPEKRKSQGLKGQALGLQGRNQPINKGKGG